MKGRFRESDPDTLERVGVVACLLALRTLRETGTGLSWTDFQRALDPYYVVLQEPVANSALQRGIDAAIDRIRELRTEGREEELESELVTMLVPSSAP